MTIILLYKFIQWVFPGNNFFTLNNIYVKHNSHVRIIYYVFIIEVDIRKFTFSFHVCFILLLHVLYKYPLCKDAVNNRLTNFLYSI